jgi:hypothetical protein
MTDIIFDLFRSFSVLTITSLIIYFAGHLLYSFFTLHQRNKYKSFFIKIAIGLISTIILFAIVRTRFATLYTGVIIAFLFNKRIRTARNFVENLKSIEYQPFIYYFISLIIITLGAVALFYFDNRLFTHHDLAFFASLGSSLHEYGIETINTDSIMIGKSDAVLYHYFNEWWVALFMYFVNLPSLKILLILVLPLFVAVLSSGSLSLANDFITGESQLKKLFISWTFLLIPGLFSFIFHSITHLSIKSDYSIIEGGIVIMKVKIVLILLLLFLTDLKINLKESNFFTISLIPLFWNTLIPVFLGAYILYIIYALVNKKSLRFKSLFQLLIPIIYIPIHLMLINLITTRTEISLLNHDDYSLVNYLSAIYSNTGYIIKTLILYILPVSCIFILTVRYFDKIYSNFTQRVSFLDSEHSIIILFSILMFLAAIFSFGILRSLFNARQIIMNLFYPFINILLFLILLILLERKRNWITPILAAGYILIFLHAFIFRSGSFFQTKDYYNRFSFFSQKQASLIASDVSMDRTPFSLYKKPFPHLLMLSENYKPLRLDLLYDMSKMSPADKIEYLQSVKSQPYYRFVKMNQLSPYSDLSKIKFIEKFNIKYILIDSAVYNDKSSYIKNLQVEKAELFEPGIMLLKIK